MPGIEILRLGGNPIGSRPYSGRGVGDAKWVKGEVSAKMRMRAAYLHHLGQQLTLSDLATPHLVRGQVLVKILFSGVCRSQLMEITGERGADPWLPHLLGHEASGTVIEVGPGVTKVSPGDAVILSWIKGEGLDAPGAQYEHQGETINSGSVTTFSTYSIVAENRVILKPKGLASDVAALFGCAVLTGSGMVLNELQPPIDSSLVVLGLGGIGISALLTAVALGLERVIAIDISEEKLEYARLCGAHYTLNSKRADATEVIRGITDGGADFCVESAGLAETIELGFGLIRDRGSLVFSSHPPDGQMVTLPPHDLIRGKSISGSWGGSCLPDRDVPRIYELIKDRIELLQPLLTHRYSLGDINSAVADLAAGRVFRPLIVMDHSDKCESSS